MKYYKLIYNYNGSKEYIVCINSDVGGMDYLRMYQGIPVESWGGDYSFEYKPVDGKIRTDYVNNLEGWLLVSKKFEHLTSELIKDSVQYLPVKVKNMIDENEITDYTVINVTDMVQDIIDYEKSDTYKYISKRPDGTEFEDISIRKYAFFKDKLEGRHMFSLAEHKYGAVFVSEALKKIVEDNKMTGFDFYEVKLT